MMNSPEVQGKLVVTNIDLIAREDDGPEDIFNDASFALHLNRGFVIVDVLEPPVYDDVIVYAGAMHGACGHFSGEDTRISVSHLRDDPDLLVNAIRDLSYHDFGATRYDHQTGEMSFRKRL